MASSDLPFNTKYGPIDGFNFQFYQYNRIEDIEALLESENVAGLFISTVLVGRNGIEFADEAYIK